MSPTNRLDKYIFAAESCGIDALASIKAAMLIASFEDDAYWYATRAFSWASLVLRTQEVRIPS